MQFGTRSMSFKTGVTYVSKSVFPNVAPAFFGTVSWSTGPLWQAGKEGTQDMR